jgi:DUF1680 family protein
MTMSGGLHRICGIASAVALTLCGFVTLFAGEVTDTRQSNFAMLRPVRLDEVRWTRGDSGSGFWADRFDTLRTRSIPAMWDIMKGAKYKPFYQHFLIAAGDMEGEYHGAPWNDGDFYKFLEAVCATYAVTRNPELEAILQQSIAAIGKAQREDGYIHTPVLIAQRNGEPVEPFQDRHNFEMYNMGHLITAACLHQRVTGRDEFLVIARKTADFLDETFRNPTPELAHNSVCPSHYMAMVELYRTTREPRYLELAKKFLEMRNMVTDGGDDNQDRIPFVEQREAAGHAVRANYLYAGAADVYLETGDAALREPLEAIWKNVVEKKMYITGGCGALYDGASPDGSEDQSHIARVHQAYGRDYQLPNTTAHNETCAAVGNVLWNWRMFLATGEARYVDVVELALYNAVLAGVSLDGTEYFYVNPLRQVDPLPTKLRWSRRRVPFVTSYCCPPNVLRTIAEVNGYAYSTTKDALWINLYGSNQLATKLLRKPLKLTQSTEYPWNGRVRIEIYQCPSDEFALKLRIPGWADVPSLQVSGSADSLKAEPNSYAEVRRRWKPGDIIELHLGMTPKLMESHPLVEETSDQVAIKCGPLVYCLESAEFPKGVRMEDVAIAKGTKLRGPLASDLLQGVSVIEADVVVKSSPKWQHELYRPLKRAEETKLKVRFIPYYAWANRGPTEMTVWLPTN